MISVKHPMLFSQSDPELIRAAQHDRVGQIRKDRQVVGAVSSRDVSSATAGLQVVLTHQPFDPLMIGNDALVLLGSPDPAPAIGFELVRGRDKQFGVIEPLSRVAIVGRSCDAHQLTASRDGHVEGPVTTDVVPLLGRGALRRAPLRNSNSSACLPTRRSRAAMPIGNDQVCWIGLQRFKLSQVCHGADIGGDHAQKIGQCDARAFIIAPWMISR